ncbi:MAG: tRNA preQ1(34) S-adenosylmethionine ribosyltransferase-isomerase QueA [Candidatus Marinimicrobia bacterium]|nr:tRNA preQ1(34) S-adenosylmethionine ribosyltransferase-isomerase QueA [Candidatus Neomarinimicrobiota bacterium]
MNSNLRQRLSDYDLAIPDELIAQYPRTQRDQCRLMVVDRQSGSIVTRRFYELPELLSAGDVLVLNDTSVFPARLMGAQPDTGHQVEVFLLKEVAADTWETLVRPGKRARVGQLLQFDGNVTGRILDQTDDGRVVRFEHAYDSFHSFLDEFGRSPLPPYIRREPEQADRVSYQTVFARSRGAVAAPTAGLHFTDDLLNRIEDAGIRIVYLTHHVGLGTFQPVRHEDITRHQMGAEYYELSAGAADTINSAASSGNRVVAIGTTVTRALESAAVEIGRVAPARGWTDLFVYPPYDFKVVQVLVTNFHLPRSTLLMLVAAFAGRDLVFKAYEQAVREQYQFFSYGDAMLLL